MVGDALRMRPGLACPSSDTLTDPPICPLSDPFLFLSPLGILALPPFMFSPARRVVTNFTSFRKYTFILYSCKAYLLQRGRTPPKASSAGNQVHWQEYLLKSLLEAVCSNFRPNSYLLVSSPLFLAHSNQQSRI